MSNPKRTAAAVAVALAALASPALADTDRNGTAEERARVQRAPGEDPDLTGMPAEEAEGDVVRPRRRVCGDPAHDRRPVWREVHCPAAGSGTPTKLRRTSSNLPAATSAEMTSCST